MHMISYISESRIPFDESVPQLRSLVSLSQRKNEALGITGVLFLRGRIFFQVLEGPTEAVKELFQIIRQDDRHDSVYTLLDEAISVRRFEKWTMEGFYKPQCEEHFLDAIHNLGKYFLESGSFNPSSIVSYSWRMVASMAPYRMTVPPAHIYDA
ncbi:MAG: BLUF domain-containing protein [Pseudomonadota bacterium]